MERKKQQSREMECSTETLKLDEGPHQKEEMQFALQVLYTYHLSQTDCYVGVKKGNCYGYGILFIQNLSFALESFSCCSLQD